MLSTFTRGMLAAKHGGSTGGLRRFVDCRHRTTGPNHKSTEKFDREDSRQVLFTEDQYARLLEIAKREGKKLGAVLRDAAECMPWASGILPKNALSENG